MEKERLKSIAEGLIFASGEPLAAESLARVVDGVTLEDVQAVLSELEEEYRARSRGFMLVRVAGGYQFRTLPNLAPWIIELKKMRPARLSRAALETLAIVAYNQPVTKTRIEQIRGVESSGTLRSLMERELIEVVGRKDGAGRPMLYGTAKRFLEVFGLPDLASLPLLPDIDDLPEPEPEPEEPAEDHPPIA